MHKFTRIAAALTAFVAAGALATGAQAAEGNAQGKFQVKVLGTGVITDGSVKQVKVDALGLTTSGTLTNTYTNDNVVPTIALEYFIKPNISLETICCTTAHHVTAAAGAIKGMNLINNVVIVPATLTVKYHVTGLPYGIKPYAGIGPSVFIVMADDPSPELKAALPAVTRTKLTSEVGLAVQWGVDVPLGHGYSFSLDAKKYWIGTNATVYAGNTVALVTRNKLDPWVLSAGVGFRF